MSLSGRAGDRCTRHRRPYCLLVVLLALLTSSCDPTTPVSIAVALQVEVQLDPTAVGNDQLTFVWFGQWLNDTAFAGTGAQTASETLVLAPASQTILTQFPPSELIRPGVWRISVSVTPPGANAILDTFCYAEISPDYRIVRFTQGLTGCSPLMGGSAPLH
jgi:hypothetical protein